MKRDWIRIYRQHGIKLLMIPVLVITLLLLGFNQYVGDYLTHRQEAAELILKLDKMKATSALLKEDERKKEKLMLHFSEIQSRSYRTYSPADSLDQMQGQLSALLQTLYFENVKVTKLELKQENSVMELAVDAQFSGVPQQLPRLETALESDAKAMRINAVEIKVSNGSVGGGSQLEINARFVAMHLKSDEAKIRKP